MEKSKPKHVLEEALDFAMEDLEANREGLLSADQRSKLKHKRNKWLALNGVLAVGCVLALRDVGAGGNGQMGAALLVLLLTGALFAWSLIHWVRYSLDLMGGRVEAIEGRIQMDVVDKRRGGTRYKINCHDERFDVSKPVFLAFKSHEPYLIYYAPSSKSILSAEWLREA